VTEPVGFGVIGANSFVANAAVMPAIDAARNARIVATASRSGDVDPRWESTRLDDYDAVLRHPDVDVVYIPLPNGMHREWTERSAAVGKHVLCEKPLASDPDTARAMADACNTAGVILAEAWMTPFDRRWSTALELVRTGAIGDVDAQYHRFTFTIGPEAVDNYRWDPTQGGGALLDVGIYCLGPIVELWGAMPDLVEATALWHTSGVDARTEATLEWIDGRQARIRCSFVDPEEQRLEIIGDQASLVLDRDAHTGGAAADTIVVARGDGSVRRLPVAPSDPYLGMVESFAATVRGDAPWPRPMSSTLELLTLLERIAQASR
jgi:predicted dehydrogenase